jgi:DNA-binding NarL/FixJ family response regulator
VIKVFICDDSIERQDSLKSLFQLTGKMECVGVSVNGVDIVKKILEAKPDIVLMDINMPQVDGIEALKMLKSSLPHIKVLMQTVFEDNHNIFESIKYGANGYVLKKDSANRLVQAIEDIINGGSVINPNIASKVIEFFKSKTNIAAEYGLTERELQILTLLSEGKSYKMIGGDLHVSFHTVNSHVKKIYDKLHVASLGEAIAFYYKNLA